MAVNGSPDDPSIRARTVKAQDVPRVPLRQRRAAANATRETKPRGSKTRKVETEVISFLLPRENQQKQIQVGGASNESGEMWVLLAVKRFTPILKSLEIENL